MAIAGRGVEICGPITVESAAPLSPLARSGLFFVVDLEPAFGVFLRVEVFDFDLRFRGGLGGRLFGCCHRSYCVVSGYF